MEKIGQEKMEYMMDNKKHWIDTRLNQEEMDFLWDAVTTEQKKDTSNISKVIEDKDNWFYENVLKKHIERLFYDDWNNYRKYHIVKKCPLPEFEMNRFWVNYQRQYEFNPLHFHGGLYSFVIFMRIPTHWKEQHALSFSANSNSPIASDFAFVWSEKNSEACMTKTFSLSSEDEGRMLFFPAWLRHQVFPFYECEEERITISGNICLYDPNRLKKQEVSVSVYEEKEKTLKIWEEGVKLMKKELEMMKKEGEKDE